MLPGNKIFVYLLFSQYLKKHQYQLLNLILEQWKAQEEESRQAWKEMEVTSESSRRKEKLEEQTEFISFYFINNKTLELKPALFAAKSPSIFSLNL